MTQQPLKPPIDVLKISHANMQSYLSDTGATHVVSSSDSRSVDCSHPIFEEDEDETSSEPVEAITPTSDHHGHEFHHHVGSLGSNAGASLAVSPMKLSLSTFLQPRRQALHIRLWLHKIIMSLLRPFAKSGIASQEIGCEIPEVALPTLELA
jgi:hypothetical protein